MDEFSYMKEYIEKYCEEKFYTIIRFDPDASGPQAYKTKATTREELCETILNLWEEGKIVTNLYIFLWIGDFQNDPELLPFEYEKISYNDLPESKRSEVIKTMRTILRIDKHLMNLFLYHFQVSNSQEYIYLASDFPYDPFTEDKLEAEEDYYSTK